VRPVTAPATEVVGEALDPQMLGTLSDEQRAQLAKLRQEAQALS
jgi:hypothetical protein